MAGLYVVQDSSFIVNLIGREEVYHDKAVNFLNMIISPDYSNKIKIIFPSICIYESMVTLKKIGVSQAKIEDWLFRLVNIKNVIITQISELSILKHCKVLSFNTSDKAPRTNDFLIYSIAKEHNALILTFDNSFVKKTKDVLSYNDIYNCCNDNSVELFRKVLEEKIV